MHLNFETFGQKKHFLNFFYLFFLIYFFFILFSPAKKLNMWYQSTMKNKIISVITYQNSFKYPNFYSQKIKS